MPDDRPLHNGGAEMPRWHFKRLRPGDTTREPIQGEFFATEAISNSAAALVREGIQNSLDARHNGQRVQVRIRICGKEGAISPQDVAPYLEGAWLHLEARPNGLREPPSQRDRCPYLVFEDFGTTGLEGDPGQWHKKDDVRNGFFTFFRAEGHSDKGESDRGRWGVGKTVFPRSSRISSFWGVTVRASDGRRCLMGRAILKSHEVNGTRHVPDGYFGSPGNDELVLPVGEPKYIDGFCRVFGLMRGADPGLSLVVPWYDLEEITLNALLEAVVEGYFFPILAGDLEVTVAGPDGRPHHLAADTLLETVRRLGGPFATTLLPRLELAVWARDISRGPFLTLQRPSESRALHWSADLIGKDATQQLRRKLQMGERIAVRVPMPVREKRKPVRWSFFDVFMVRDGTEERGRPVYVREGIIIPDVRGKTTRGIRALVVVEDKPLAAMLGDSENPAHTQWQNGSNYKGKYLYAADLKFVSDSVAEIVRLVTEAEEEADPAVLIDLFSLPAERDAADAIRCRTKKAGPPRGPHPPQPPAPPQPRPKAFRVHEIVGGFRITRGDNGVPTPNGLEIRVAYDIRKGNPLRKYHKADFQLDKLPIRIGDDLDGIEVISRSLNQMVVKVTKPDFRLSVTGFDENRDLYVRVLAREDEKDGDQTA